MKAREHAFILKPGIAVIIILWSEMYEYIF
jgi:hypothetical protein